MAERHVWIPMADGVRLAASLFLPDTGDPCPVRGVRFVADAAVDSTATWNLDSGRVTAVRVKGPKGAAATLRMAWNDKGRHPLARVTGRAGNARLAGTLPAP